MTGPIPNYQQHVKDISAYWPHNGLPRPDSWLDTQVTVGGTSVNYASAPMGAMTFTGDSLTGKR